VKALVALLVLSLLAIGAPHAREVSRLSPTDRQILQMLLDDFARRRDSVQYNRDSPHTYVALVPAGPSACGKVVWRG